jgi:hypothetical protein
VPVDSYFLLGLAKGDSLLGTGLTQGIAKDGHGRVEFLMMRRFTMCGYVSAPWSV